MDFVIHERATLNIKSCVYMNLGNYKIKNKIYRIFLGIFFHYRHNAERAKQKNPGAPNVNDHGNSSAPWSAPYTYNLGGGWTGNPINNLEMIHKNLLIAVKSTNYL